MLEIGSLVDGKYKILNVVGKGGMSVVYLAMNERANKQWAIKEVRKDGVQDFEVVKQNLIVETDILKNLNHPNLPSIIDVIDREDSFLIVMDYIEGKALSDVLKEYGAQPQEYVIEWAKQLCDVLGYLHSRVPPIIYRDMKPSNVMLKPDGNLTLIDFGTAREFKASKVEDTTCLGTRGYAAPEQYGGHGQTDGRTDIYCLGATMYHLVTGHNPSQPPYEMYPIRNWDPNLSSGLEEIIIKCTKYNPEDRYQNCQELMYTNGHKNDAEGTLNSDFVFRKGSEHASLLDFYDYVTFGYFTKGKIAVVIEAHDDVSGIQYVDVDIDGESSERHLISDTAKGNGMTHKSGNTWGTIIIKDADYKGKIKAKPTDMSGNTASKYTEPRGVISETQSQHNKAKTMKITTLTKPSNTANGINYYNRSVAVNISMGDSHSGLKSWGYTAGTAVKDNKNYGEAAGTTDKNGNPTVNNVYSMNKTVTMAAGDTNYTNKDNPTMVETEFEDNAGWTEKANEKYVIDDKKPIIKVDWTSSANVMNEKYYKATRVAHITVTERNFNEAGVDWQINNETGVVKSGWSHNGDTHTCDVSFTKDGDFILNFKITDYAMNSDSYKGEEFTIDKTAPVISISFDRNNPSNGYYFNTPRTATLHIEEHNFAAKDVTYELSGSNDGKGIGSPTAGGWSTGSDHHTASIYYGSDGEFSLNFNYTDMAGNPANKIQTEKFVIDLTKPVCKITNVEDHAAYNGKVAPGIEYSDTNLDENQVTVKLVGNKVGNASYEKNAPVSIHNGRTVQWKDFARKEKVDDIYTMELTIKDKAGNESTDKKVFSVNRFGSNYIFGTDTQALLDKIYSNQEIPVEVREINVNSLKEKAISVKNEDNEITELQAGSDYTVTEGNDKYKWKEYRYVINGDVFAQESEYNVTLSSKDAAANEMNNVAKNKDIDFIIDKTNPTGIVSGLEESSYKEDSHKINVRAMDNYQLDEAVLYVDGSEYKTFASEDFQGDKGVEVTLDSKNKPQEIYLSLTDKAGNSVDLKKTQCLITSNAWIQYINNKPLFYSTVGGGAALIIAILGIATRGFGYASSMAAQSGFWWTILGKRREDEDED